MSVTMNQTIRQECNNDTAVACDDDDFTGTNGEARNVFDLFL